MTEPHYSTNEKKSAISNLWDTDFTIGKCWSPSSVQFPPSKWLVLLILEEYSVRRLLCLVYLRSSITIGHQWLSKGKSLDRHQFRIRLFLKFPLWPMCKFNINREWDLKEHIRKIKSWNSKITYLLLFKARWWKLKNSCWLYTYPGGRRYLFLKGVVSCLLNRMV